MPELLRRSGTTPAPSLVEEEARDIAQAPAAQSQELVRQALAARGLSDNFFLGSAILRYNKLTPRTHGPICRFLEQVSTARRMILHPRSTFKTTIAVIIDSIRKILSDPNFRILVLMDTDKNAALAIGEMQTHFERNELFRWVYAESIPENFNKVRWNTEELELGNRTRFWKEANITAIGLGGAAESKHFDMIKADDIIAEKHIHSDAEMDKACKIVTGLEPLLISEDRTIDFIGSRKKRGDVYDTVEKFYVGDGAVRPIGPYAELRGELVVFSRGMIENGEPIFPEHFSLVSIERMKKNDPERYHAQYANNPRASGLNTFREEDLRFFEIEPGERGELWATSDTLKRPIDIWGMERILLFDPAVAERNVSSKQALLVVAKGGGPWRFILEALVAHIPPDEAVDEFFRMYREWNPSICSIEGRGYQGSIKYWLQERAEHTGVDAPPVLQWPPEGSPKAQWAKTEHIRGLQPLVRNHFFYLLESQEELVDEFATYPNTRWDDGLDALAQGLEYWPYQEPESEREARVTAEEKYLSMVMRGTSGMRALRLPQGSQGSLAPWDETEFLASLNSGGYAARKRSVLN